MLLRGMRWRLGASLLMVFASAVAVGAALLGPLYLRAASDSLIRSAVAAAPVQQAGLAFTPAAGAHVTLTQLEDETHRLSREYELSRWYGAPLVTAMTGVRVPAPGSHQWQGQLLYRTGICARLRFRAGGCQLGTGDVLLSARSARVMRVGLGSAVQLALPAALGSTSLQLHVTGIYDVPNLDLPYWWGDGPGYFPFGTGTSASASPTDSLITSAATATDVAASAVPSASVQMPLRRGAVGLADKAELERTLVGVRHDAGLRGIALSTGAVQLIGGADRQGHLMNTIVGVASIQLVLVAIWVLAALLVRSADQRSLELRVARLRGFPLVSLFTVAVAEPASLCVIGAVIGVAGAWAVTDVAKRLFMARATAITIGPLVFAALGVAVLTVAVVLVATALRALRGSSLRDPAVSQDKPSSRLRFTADVCLLLLSVIALVALATSGALAAHGNPVASAAPGLLALGTTVLAVQLMLFLCRRGVALTLDSTWVPGMLAMRQVARRPAILREGRVLIVTLCLACFAVSAWSIARTNRRTASTFAVGAQTVVTVRPRGRDLQQAVDRIDPHGRFAMAAVQISTPSTELLAVDARRLPAVAFWPAGTARASIEQISRALTPAAAPTVELPAGSLRLRAEVAASGTLASHLDDLELAAWVFNPQLTTTVVALGRLHRGHAGYSASTRLVCPGGCRLVGVGIIPTSARALAGGGRIELTLEGVAVRSHAGRYRTLPADLTAGGWRATTQGVRLTHAGAGTVSFAIALDALSGYSSGLYDTSPPMAAVADYPSNLPGVAGAASLNSAATTYAATAYGTKLIASSGLDGNPISIRPVLTAASLPRVGSDAQLVDLGFLMRAQLYARAPGATDQVWLGPAAPHDAVSRLAAAGLVIDRVQRASTLATSMQQAGPELAYDFMLLAMLVALLAGAASSLGLLGSELRERATELTALELVGVPRALLLRSLALESVVLAVTAMFGAAAGVVGSALAIPSLPEAATRTGTPRSYALPWPLLIAVCAGMVVVIAAAAAITTTGVLRRMSPKLLWGAPDGDAS